jgi:hypothetical protein
MTVIETANGWAVVAESTGFSKTRIFQAIRNGELTARKDGKATVIETDELLRWLRSRPTRGRRLPTTDDVAPSVEAGTT